MPRRAITRRAVRGARCAVRGVWRLRVRPAAVPALSGPPR